MNTDFPSVALADILAYFQGAPGACIYKAIHGGLDLLKFAVNVIHDCEEDHPEPQPLGSCPCPDDADCCKKLLELKAACCPDDGCEDEGMKAVNLPPWAVPLIMSLVEKLLNRLVKR